MTNKKRIENLKTILEVTERVIQVVENDELELYNSFVYFKKTAGEKIQVELIEPFTYENFLEVICYEGPICPSDKIRKEINFSSRKELENILNAYMLQYLKYFTRFQLEFINGKFD